MQKSMSPNVGISRRSFLAMSGLVGAGVALSSAPVAQAQEEAVEGAIMACSAADEASKLDFDTVTWGACHVNCGSRCPLKAYVKDGTVVRISTDCEGSDEFGPGKIAQLRSCVRGRTSRQRIYNETRVQRPLKRVEGTKRGEGIYEEISWEEAIKTIADSMKEIKEQYGIQMERMYSYLSDSQLAREFRLLSLEEDDYIWLYDHAMPPVYSTGSYEASLHKLGYVDLESPSTINIYAATFEDKDAIAGAIERYNETVSEEDKIEYTDMVALLMSSITTIINVISYVLIAFVAISLVVSSIMIGIITYISVLERTKEIGILRAIGASKKDVSRVFNAETFIIGLTAGVIGIVSTLLLNIPINIIIHDLTGIMAINSTLPVAGAVGLVIISVALTFIAGLIPSGLAAKKDPVEALRTE